LLNVFTDLKFEIDHFNKIPIFFNQDIFKMDPLIPKEVKILESAEDIQNRRFQVLDRYSEFKAEARLKREKLEDSRRFQVI